MKEHISGVILYDETIRQKAKDGTPLVKLIEQAGAIPGIKVDAGAKPLAFCPGEMITEGLDGLRERLIEYHKLGARFAKWRAVIDIGPGIPSYTCIMANAHALARYAALCQENGIVPIVEPEVLMDGDHDIDRCDTSPNGCCRTVFEQLYYQRVALEGMVLKPNMVDRRARNAPSRPSVEEVAEKTVRLLKACVPPAVPGIAFLSGGQSDEDATAHLDAMNARRPALAADLLLWPRAAARAADGVERQGGECRRGAARLRASRPDEWAGGTGRMEGGDGAEGGVRGCSIADDLPEIR